MIAKPVPLVYHTTSKPVLVYVFSESELTSLKPTTTCPTLVSLLESSGIILAKPFIELTQPLLPAYVGFLLLQNVFLLTLPSLQLFIPWYTPFLSSLTNHISKTTISNIWVYSSVAKFLKRLVIFVMLLCTNSSMSLLFFFLYTRRPEQQWVTKTKSN